MSTLAPITCKVAVFYQATTPPSFGGVAKPAKPGGYRDSCADIAFALSSLKHSPDNATRVEVVLPSEDQEVLPSATDDAAWSFPDTADGIRAAIARGADTLWMNTVLHREHPLFTLLKADLAGSTGVRSSIKYIGQLPEHAEDYDDKAVVNPWLAQTDDTKLLANGFPKSLVLSKESIRTPEGFNAAMQRIEQELGLPCVLKPIRGRGSHGVAVIHDIRSVRDHAATLFAECPEILAEEFLNGEEITIAIMPPGEFDAPVGKQPTQWTLPIVIRSQHVNDITPYNGVQAVAENSAAITPEQYEKDRKQYEKVEKRVRRAGQIMGTRSVARIDCRRNRDGEFKLFDINMKPNATGPGRPGRNNQTSLVGMAAEALGWEYQTLLVSLVRAATALQSSKTS
ncbi:hypothetical protein QFC21_000875 [Naganishia friedmannii]|uniref:Uncharacterized protein n=1 Tax=Naganishia friedmannii TaxID=89922 RepID=A0ACC2W6Q4_9TREE|nr:hypothetical protein QFC21_000875 [Naganishia friedmannii]